MRILVYSHAFAPMVGGVETIVMLLADGIAQNGNVQLALATRTAAGSMNDATLPFRVVRRPTFLELARLVQRADVVHLAGPALLPMLLVFLCHKPFVVEHHGFQAACPNGLLLYEPRQEACPGHFMAGRYLECIRCNGATGKLDSLKMLFVNFLRRWLCQRAARNILPTEWLGTVLQLKRMQAIVHGLSPIESPSVHCVSVPAPTFIYLGRLVSTKGVRVLLEAAHLLKGKALKFQVKIIGEGPNRGALEELTRHFGIQDCVEFLGYVPNERVQEKLAASTAIVMPSLAGEVFGLVAAENMRHGRLVIVSDSGALAEVVGDAGMKFPLGDAMGLAQCMEAVILNPSLARELGAKAAQRVAEMFDWETMVEEHLEVYREITEARSRPNLNQI